ncbi:Uncharacterised protein [uncultured archaeon]|nr:Uncharacterised protein [uncultured archaeon]
MAEETKRTMKFAKVHRAVYSFNVSRLFVPVRRFIKKSTELTPEMIREYITSLFTATVRKDTKAQARAKVIESKSPGMRNLILISLLILLAMFGYGAFVYIRIIGAPPTANVTNMTRLPPAPSVIAHLADSGFLDSGKSGTRWFATIDLEAEGLDDMNLSLTILQNPVPQDVYVLRVPNYQFASHYPEFYAKLKGSLAGKGIFISEITVDELLSMPKDKRIVLIVPSGNFPSALLGGESPPFDMKSFAQAGNILVYIGFKPSEGVLTRQSPAPQPVSADSLAKYGLLFSTETGQPQSFTFRNPLFSVKSGGLENSRATVRGQQGEYSVSWGGDGFVYFIATTVDFWWSFSGENSAVELADAVSSARWGVGLAKGTMRINATDGTVPNQRTVVFTGDYTSTEGSRLGRASGQLFIQAAKHDGNDSSFTGRLVSVPFGDRPNGILKHDEQFISSALTGEAMQVTYSLNEQTTALKQVFLSAIASNGTETLFTPITSAPISLKVTDAVYLFDNRLTADEYIVRITDDQRHLFAQSYLQMVSFRPESVISDFAHGLFIFNVVMQGEKDPYSAKLSRIVVSLDGQDRKELNLTKGQILYNATPTTSPGNHTFLFQFGDDMVPVVVQYIRPISIFEKPENLAAIAITVLLFGIGMMIARPETVSYSVDVPDFPPLQAIAIPVKRETVLDLFESVNRDLRWQQTPLSISDLKSGFKKILFRGRPIAIGDYNLETILDKLREEGYVDQAMEYYGLKRWERETRKSIHSLAMTRALRDTFVTEGIPFLPFGQRGDSDTVISYGGEKVYIHIYETDTVIKRAIESASVGRSIVVFENEIIMRDYLGRIHSSAEMNVVFKLLLDSGKISVTPVAKLMDVLNRRKLFRY